jgi:hypothetical protein
VKLTPEDQAAFIAAHAPRILGGLCETLARRLGCEPNEVGLTLFFCTGGHQVQMFSNLTEESVRQICTGYANQQGPLEAAVKTH